MLHIAVKELFIMNLNNDKAIPFLTRQSVSCVA